MLRVFEVQLATLRDDEVWFLVTHVRVIERMYSQWMECDSETFGCDCEVNDVNRQP